MIKVLPRVNFSDHHPLLVVLDGVERAQRTRYFRFESAWLLEDSYDDMLKTSWNEIVPMQDKLKNLSHEIEEWKNITVDSVLIKKRELLACIGGIQKHLQRGRNNLFLVKLEKELQQELENILNMEELMWFQRWRAKWLTDGDRNTRYYHLKAITRRRGNQILTFRDDYGNWVEDREDLKHMANDFYKMLFYRGGY